jgi:hypothetical protein
MDGWSGTLEGEQRGEAVKRCRICDVQIPAHRFVCEACTKRNDEEDRKTQEEEWAWYQALAGEERRNSVGSERHPASTNDLLRAAMAECFAALRNWNYTEHITRLYLIALILHHRIKRFRQEFDRAKGEAALRYWPPVPLPDFATPPEEDTDSKKLAERSFAPVEKRSLIDLALENADSEGQKEICKKYENG